MCAGKPCLAYAREAPAFVPAGKPSLEGACERFEDGGAGAGVRTERGYRAAGILGRQADIDADANRYRQAGSLGASDALDQDARDLGTAEENVVRPFKVQAAVLFHGQMACYGIEGGKRGNERKLGGNAGAYAGANP